MPRPPSLHKMIMARLELERLARRPAPLTERQRRWITGPLARAWHQWQASTAAEAPAAVRALYIAYNRTWRRWETVRAARTSGRPEDDPTLYALLPRCPAPCRALRCGARTRRGTPCKRIDLYASSRCSLHGGKSTGPRTPEGKARSALNGHCPKRHKQPPCEAEQC